MSDAIVQLLRTFYDAGLVPCADAPPLRITFDPDAGEVRLRPAASSTYDVIFQEGSFVEMVERSGMRPSETLIRVWLGTIYFDPQVYPWAKQIALSAITSNEDSGAAR
jgi:hypothetical protein